jgi:putative ABC transport system ATP-binding protein
VNSRSRRRRSSSTEPPLAGRFHRSGGWGTTKESVEGTNIMTASTQSLIRLDAVGKVFYTEEFETHALANVYLVVEAGEYVAVAGPSGCGKTTLLSILGLLDTPTTGSYELKGHPVSGLTATQRARIRNREIGFIFQAFNLIGDLTVYENVELPLTYRNDVSGAERRERVHDALERVGMSHRAKHYPAQLSGGQQQRVAVARAIGGRPSVLLADEPTGNLDSTNGEAVMELLRELHREGSTIIMVTHDPRYEQHAERSVHLFDGKVVRDERSSLASRLEEHGFRAD